ncbi:YdcF family protein [uncultured Arcticibacterium sp.]|uniref:YdcF family protein n=1 Tax=uncultured Arcticibacterium sp. TaxID=2173042 RepID=UPI0030F85E9B
MFYIVSKLFTFLLMPLGIIMVLTFCVIVCKNRTKAKKLGFLTLLLTYLFSVPILENALVKYWETPQKNIDNLATYEVGILLTGGLINSSTKYPDNLNLDTSGDRLWQTLHLFKEGKIKHIIISGGNISLINKSERTEIEYAYQFLIKNGVAKELILLDKKARNTNENAINSSTILNEKFKDASCLIITSAFHMKRAVACFKKRGVSVSSFPSNVISSYRNTFILDFLPSTDSLLVNSRIFKEIIGLTIYKIMGYA